MEHQKKIVMAAASAAALTAVLIYGTSVAGCANTMKKPADDPRPDIGHAMAGVIDIPPLMDHATAETKKIDSVVPPAVLPVVQPHTEAIRQDASAAKLKATTATADLKTATQASEGLTAANGQLQAANGKLTTELQDAKVNNFRGVLVLAFLTFVSGVGLIVYGNGKLGGALAAAGIAGVVLALVMAKAALLVGVGAGVLLLAALSFMAYRLYVEKKATVELVQTAEAGKQLLTAEHRTTIYGCGAIPGKADVIQSSTTKKLVSQTRGLTTPGSVRLAS